MLGNSDVIILDVRADQNWKNAESKIKGAIREERNEESSAWMDKYPKDKTLIFYCS
jgi:rhodanese-related sulfurtransferase